MKFHKPRHKVYIVDDDNTFVFLTKRSIIMENLCEHLSVFSNGQMVLDELKQCIDNEAELPDAILLDVNMPEMGGWAFIEAFAELKPRVNKNIAIHMVSSSVNKKDVERAGQCEHVSSYTVKPIRSRQLLEIFGVEENLSS